MIERRGFVPRPDWDSFETMFKKMAGIDLETAESLAKLPGKTGEFNRERIAWWKKVWARYKEITTR